MNNFIISLCLLVFICVFAESVVHTRKINREFRCEDSHRKKSNAIGKKTTDARFCVLLPPCDITVAGDPD